MSLTRKLVVFDLDHTLLTSNCSFTFGLYLYRNGFFSFFQLLGCLTDYARHKWLRMSPIYLHKKTCSRIFAGKSVKEVELLANQFLTKSLDNMLNKTVYQRLQEAKIKGDQVIILSGSPDFLVGNIAKRLQVPLWKSTSYETSKNEVFLGVGEVMCGEEKRKYIKKVAHQLHLCKENITVYVDSYLDLELIQLAGVVVGVAPDKELKAMCVKNHWEMIP